MRAEDLNRAVKELAGEQHTCKDLRTWNATVLAAVTLAAAVADGGVPGSERTRKRLVNQAIKQVSEHLGNTPRSPAPPTSTRGCWSSSARAARCCPPCAGSPGRPDLSDDATRAQVERAVVRLIAS